jgi:hypothetical protein
MPVIRRKPWAGRGKQPRWMMQQLKSGRHVDDFRLQQAAQERELHCGSMDGRSVRSSHSGMSASVNVLVLQQRYIPT